MNSLERITPSAPVYRAVNASEAAMILGGQETVNTFVRNGDGSLTYVGSDLIIEPAKRADAVDSAP